MSSRFSIAILILAAVVAVSCTRTNETANANDNANANASVANQPTTRPAPDNSEITTAVDSSGTKTETRTFRNNPRVSKVVVTTRDGRRTVRVYSPKGEEKEVTGTDAEDVLDATGEKVADSAHFVADKAEDVGGEVKKGAETAADKTVDSTKKVATEAADKVEDVGDKTVSGSKKVVKKATSGVKKAGSAVKKVIP